MVKYRRLRLSEDAYNKLKKYKMVGESNDDLILRLLKGIDELVMLTKKLEVTYRNIDKLHEKISELVEENKKLKSELGVLYLTVTEKRKVYDGNIDFSEFLIKPTENTKSG